MQSLLKFQQHFSQRKKKNPKILEMWVLSPIQSCLTLCYLMDCSPSGYSVHGTLQAKILECVAMPFSRESSRPRDQTQIYLNCRQILYCLSHLGSSNKYYKYIYIYIYMYVYVYIYLVKSWIHHLGAVEVAKSRSYSSCWGRCPWRWW